MEFVKTQRGARALLHEGYRYVVNRRGRDERIFWRCGKSRNCSGCLCTLKDEIISTNDNHNHPPDEASNEVDKIVDSIKGKVRTTAQPIQQSTLKKYKQLPLMQTETRLQPNYQHFQVSRRVYIVSEGHLFHHCQKQEMMYTLMVRP